MKKLSKTFALVAGMLFLGASQLQAALVAPEFSSDDAILIGTAVIGGLALIWGIRKAIAMAGR